MTLLWLALILLAALCLLEVRSVVRFRGLVLAQLAAYRRGDYHGQLTIVERFRTRRSEPSHYLFFRGAAC